MSHKNRVYFLHIPKTAGSSFNALFKEFVPASRYFIHLESKPKALNDLRSSTEPYYASGHISIRDCRHLVADPDVYSITIIRDPAKQLVSHLKWVKMYGDPRFEKLATTIPQSIFDLASRMFKVSLSDLDAMRPILAETLSMQLFDNLQTRYLSDPRVARVADGDFAAARRNLEEFDLVVSLEDYDDAVAYLEEKFSLKADRETRRKLNEAKIEEDVDFGDPQIRDFYEPFIRYDRIIHRRAMEIGRSKVPRKRGPAGVSRRLVKGSRPLRQMLKALFGRT